MSRRKENTSLGWWLRQAYARVTSDLSHQSFNDVYQETAARLRSSLSS
jgi:IS1 family transposase